MPILSIFLLTAACLPNPWPSPPFDLGPGASAGLTAAAVLVPLSAAFALRTWVVRALRRDPGRKSGVGQAYARLRQALFFANLGTVVLSIAGLGWGWTTQHTLTVEWHGDTVLAPFAELAVPLPYFLIVFGCWLIYYDVDRALHQLSAGGGGRFWSRAGYFFHHLRQLALLVALPVGLFVTQQTLTRFAPEASDTDWYRAGSVVAVLGLILVMPVLMKPLLGLRSLPAGPVRGRIEAVARRLHFRYADLLVWPTHGHTANAMIVGLVPRLRYVIFTDRILEELPDDELDAVFGHEVGHARHGHIWFYALFLGLSMLALAAVLLLVVQQLDAAGVMVPERYRGWVTLPPMVLAAGYVFLVFGFLSRRCERQADVFGCRAVSCADPACTGHDATTAYPERGVGLCPTGIRTCARALERVYHLNGYDEPEVVGPLTVGRVVRATLAWLRAWQHSTIPRRIRFLLSLIDDRGRERRFQRRLAVLRWWLAIALAVAIVVLVELVTWQELRKTL
jgi:Zn-dependent protease with chaperone function